MKKRLLITSIVMMLVIAVALSTATYAWFTSNTSVKASSMTLKAAVSDQGALGIGWLGGSASSSITSAVKGTLSPMAPEALTVGTTTSAVTFYTSTIKEEAGIQVFNGLAQTNPTPITFNDGAASTPTSAFYVKNLSTTNSIASITCSAVFETKVPTADTGLVTGKTYYTYANGSYTAVETPSAGSLNSYYEDATGNDMIRVAIFTKAASTGTNTAVANYTLKGILANAASATVFGAAEKFGAGEAVTGLSSVNAATSFEFATNLAAGQQVDVVAIAWLDGTALTDANAGKIGGVSLSFGVTGA